MIHMMQLLQLQNRVQDGFQCKLGHREYAYRISLYIKYVHHSLREYGSHTYRKIVYRPYPEG